MISPVDSLSRALAAQMPVDTLLIHGVIESVDGLMVHPRTVGFSDDGTIWVTDSRVHRVLSFDSSGVLASVDTLEGATPYLAGVSSDSVFIYSPVDHSVWVRAPRGSWETISLEGELPVERALTYVVKTPSGFTTKVLGDDFEGYLGNHSEDGALLHTTPISGPSWRYAGMLREHEGAIYSLVGYRPMIDRLRSAGLDSLQLVGFDSPMLARSHQFVLGNADQPPLLSASAAFVDEYILMLNMRPGWLNLDVFDLEGRLQYILTQPNPSFAKEYYPSDLAVRAVGDGSYELAVTVTEPAPRIDRFIWWPGN